MKASPPWAVVIVTASLGLTGCHKHEEGEHHEQQRIVLTSPELKEVVVTQQYVSQIHSQKHIKICALENGYLEEITVKEGQAVKQGDPLFKVMPVLYKARLDAEAAKVRLAQLKLEQTKRLYEQKVVSVQDVYLHEAELAEAQAKMTLAEAELNFATVKAPFDGIIDRLYHMQGSLVKEGDDLTSLSDNSLMWVYFNVPEKRYLEYMNGRAKLISPSQMELLDAKIELRLADGNIFKHSADNVVTVEGMFNNETGNIEYRADFPNPDRILRQGQTGTVLILQKMKNALVIPQRATFELLDKQYVYVVDEAGVAHRRLITIKYELEDTYVIEAGLTDKDKIVLEGVRQVHDGEKLDDTEFRKPDEALSHQKFHAE